MHQCATFIAVYADWGFARVKGVGWGWGGIIWLYSLVTFFPLDILKFITRYVLSGRGWENITENKVISIDRNIYIYIYDCYSELILTKSGMVTNRLHLLPRKTTEERKERHSGQQHRELSTVYKPPRAPPIFSPTKVVTENSPKLLSKPRGELKLQGRYYS